MADKTNWAPVGGFARQCDNDGDAELLKLLVAHRLVTQDQAREAQSRSNGESATRVLVRDGVLKEDQVLKVRAAQQGIPAWDPARDAPTPEAIPLVPGHVCRAHLVLPIRVSNKLLSLAMANPMNMGAIDTVRNISGMRVEPMLADESKLAAAIEQIHGEKALRESFAGLIAQAQKDYGALGGASRNRAQLSEADTRPVVGLVNHILTWAIRMGASDVHIEPRSNRVDVRFRIDGEMQKVQELPSNLLPMLATRLKIMGELDIVESRVPQDGRMAVTIDNRNVDIRMSVLPNHHGPRLVMRILDRSLSIKTLEEVGFSANDSATFKQMLHRPHGMLLVTGPTGSGKTTTLYAALKELQHTGRNIMTCEDPVEYEIDGISQSQVNEKVGLTFAAQLRATLRQDPDVILVGEIRDKETADTAIRAALTGHFVLSTLHCNDAPGAIPRLLDMGIDPYLLSTCLIGITAQRLVRTLCPKCKDIAHDNDETAELAKLLGIEGLPLALEARGCPQCFQTGYRGRAAVHEVLAVTSDVSEGIAAQHSIPEIRRIAAQNGYEPLQAEALRKVCAGETTIHEASRVVAFESFGSSSLRLAA